MQRKNKEIHYESNDYANKYNKANQYYQLGKFKEAAEVMEELLKQKNNTDMQITKTCRFLIFLYSHLYRDTNDTVYLKKQKVILDISPIKNTGQYVYNRASYEFDMGNIEETKILLVEIQEKYSTDINSVEKAKKLSMLIDVRENKKLTEKEANEKLIEIKNYKKSNLSALLRLASSDYRDLINLDEIQIISSGDYEDLLKEARFYAFMDLYKQSYALFQYLIEKFPEIPLSCRARLDYTGHLFQDGNYNEIINILLPIHDAYESNGIKISNKYLLDTYKLLAIAYNELGNVEESVKFVNAGKKLDQNNGSLNSTFIKQRDNRNGSNNKHYEALRKSSIENMKRFNRNHPKEKENEIKISIENPDKDKISIEKVHPIIICNKQEPIVISKPVNNKVDNTKKKKNIGKSQVNKPKPKSKIEMIDYSNLYDYGDIQLYKKEVKEKKKPELIPDVISKPEIAVEQSEVALVESVSVGSAPVEVNNAPVQTNNFSCSKFLLFASAVTVIAVSAGVTLVTTMNKPGK